MQSVSLPLTFLPECSYSNPLKEPFSPPCGRPSLCPSLFSRLAALCVSPPSFTRAFPASISIYAVSQKWLIVGGFTLLFSRRASRSTFRSPCSSSLSSSCIRLTKEVKYEGGLAVTSLLSPLCFKLCLLLLSPLRVALPTLFSSTCALSFLVWIKK